MALTKYDASLSYHHKLFDIGVTHKSIEGD